MKNRSERTKERAAGEILHYGRKILTDRDFRRAMGQSHHKVTSVGRHSLSVSMTSLKMCYALEKLHIHTNRQAVVVGALCHDLGILGRTGKFRNNRECCRQHPLDSVEAAKRICPDLDEKTEQIISRHMFPLTPKPPMNREGVIVTIADKYCSVKDRLVGPLLGGGQEKAVSDKIPTLKKADFLRAGQK